MKLEELVSGIENLPTELAEQLAAMLLQEMIREHFDAFSNVESDTQQQKVYEWESAVLREKDLQEAAFIEPDTAYKLIDQVRADYHISVKVPVMLEVAIPPLSASTMTRFDADTGELVDAAILLGPGAYTKRIILHELAHVIIANGGREAASAVEGHGPEWMSQMFELFDRYIDDNVEVLRQSAIHAGVRVKEG